ncbi:hypothetical protein SAMN05421690_104910 [Nitrosomonas sp. Nm51]|uniref:hypothetical protein n=1 Tax=Nitrosomonas sp. Nm51 TaxID=133720 RepID=UPI0008D6A915|nr:hypothetical protein [Nitrosomonas sp. Nm51]SER65679.1 hypothetical protein SAMN05421690_104910 [Nitrosomonas sp. Nm51]
MKKETCIIHPPSKHGSINQIFDNIWFVKGQLNMAMFLPMYISRSMTIIRDNAGLTLINPIRLSESGMQALESLGKISTVIRIGGFHGRDEAFFKARYNATIYALKGQVYTRKVTSLPNDAATGYMQADVVLDVKDPLPIANASLIWFQTARPAEAVLKLEQNDGILITADSLQNTPHPDEYHNWLAKIMMQSMGFFHPYHIGPGWLRYSGVDKNEVKALLNCDFSHVLPGHGDPVIADAREKYRPALESIA